MMLMASSTRTSLLFGLVGALASGCAHGGEAGPAAGESAAASGPQSGSVVTEDEIVSYPGARPEEVLRGRISGVTVTSARGGGIAVRIRGATSIYGSNEPLYVLDGMPIEPGPGGALIGINPYDIESIRVLKDAVDTAIYGLRGANGVIVIKTKGARR